MRHVLALVLALGMMQCGIAQVSEIHLSSKAGQMSMGLGLGLPYGAIGGRLGINLIDHLNLFVGIGHHIAGVGYNVGLRKEFSSSKAAQFYLTGMYGTNAAIKVKGLDTYDDVFVGGSFGLGLKLNSKRTKGRYWDFGLLYPIWERDFYAAQRAVKKDVRISGFTEASPVLIVVGYNFPL